jgi:sec-independent protein translocase protein TatB
MFDIGFWELALIGIVALLVVGPERMPAMIRTAGQWTGQIQRLARDLRREIEQEAQTEEFKALNSEFRAEDQRLKELARNPPTPVESTDSPDTIAGTSTPTTNTES